MKWTYTISNKFKAALALATVIILVISTNRIDHNHFERLQESFNSVYQDRLVAEKYLFELSRQFQTKTSLILNGAPSKENIDFVNDSISELLTKYEATKLTHLESKRFIELKKMFKAQLRSEANLTSTSEYTYSFTTIWGLLDELSQIQLNEARNLLDKSERIFSSNHTSSVFELSLLIIIGLILQAIVIASRPLRDILNQDKHLN
ncbi:MAG: hypothetical protein GYB32_12280 [Algicola sp.]|nr:hypothetical protein [Algicola sp.]